jgi:hypothetical protein
MLVNLQKHATREKLVVLSVDRRQDYGDEYGRLGDAYNGESIPHMIIVGRDGRSAAQFHLVKDVGGPFERQLSCRTRNDGLAK